MSGVKIQASNYILNFSLITDPITTLCSVFSSAIASLWQPGNIRLHGDETQASDPEASASRSPGERGILLSGFGQWKLLRSACVDMLKRKTQPAASGFTVKAAMKNSAVSGRRFLKPFTEQLRVSVVCCSSTCTGHNTRCRQDEKPLFFLQPCGLFVSAHLLHVNKPAAQSPAFVCRWNPFKGWVSLVCQIYDGKRYVWPICCVKRGLWLHT